MSIADHNLKQEITYWAPIAGDDGFGNQNVATPVTFHGRWQDKIQTVLSAKGEQIVSRATIYAPECIPLDPDGWIVRGRSTSVTPMSVAGAAIIRTTSEIPDLRDLNKLKVAMI